MRLTVTSLYHQRTVSLNGKQITGLLTSDKEAATRLNCWDSIKSFFVKLLNLFPCISLFDKKEFLKELYDQMHANAAYISSVNGGEFGVSLFWAYVEQLLGMVPRDQAERFRFIVDSSLSTENDAPNSPFIQLFIDNTPFPPVCFSATPEESYKLWLLCRSYLGSTQQGSNTYNLNMQGMDGSCSMVTFLLPCRGKFYNCPEIT